MKPKAPWDYPEVAEYFKSGKRVYIISDRLSIGVVTGCDRCGFTGAGRVLVRWDSTGITANVHPSQIDLESQKIS